MIALLAAPTALTLPALLAGFVTGCVLLGCAAYLRARGQ